jgi:hydroxypyruvate reductase
MEQERDLRSDMGRVIAAAIDAVRPERLVPRRFSLCDGELLFDGVSLAVPLRLTEHGRVVVVGGGKAAAGMAAGFAEVLGTVGDGPRRVTGLVSVPEGCGRDIAGIEVRETRPAAANVPTDAAVGATRAMLDRVGALGPDDIVIALISGGGSALLVAPREGVPLDEKVAIARFLTGAGAPITEINMVRQAASDVKAGGLARGCRAGRMLAVVLSDVIGDPLDSIASGPCMPVEVDAGRALNVLDRYGAVAAGIAPRLVEVLRDDLSRPCRDARQAIGPAGNAWTTPHGCRVDHVLLGSNATAVDAAADAARRLGYEVIVRHGDPLATETADEVGRRLGRESLALAEATMADDRSRAIIEGGEAVVRLPADHGVGGRNQHTALAAAVAFLGEGHAWPEGLAVASVGTDGEDGPTRAAGGLVDATNVARIAARRDDSARAAARFDAFSLLETVDGLVVTGPTGTNVADVRVVLARPGA